VWNSLIEFAKEQQLYKELDVNADRVLVRTTIECRAKSPKQDLW
jgi:hypothetical protein